MPANGNLTPRQFQDGAADWRILTADAFAWFAAPSQPAGAALVHRILDLAAGAGHRPDVNLRADGVRVCIAPSDGADLRAAEFDLARAISAAARDLGLASDPSTLQAVHLAVDAVDREAVLAFWQAALGYERVGDTDLADPLRRDPPLWFQRQDAPRPLRNRVHVDVVRPQPLTRAGAEALGGRHAEANDLTLADAEGNEADVIALGDVDGMATGSDTADWYGPFVAMTHYPVTDPAAAARLVGTAAELADRARLPLLVDLRSTGVVFDTGKDQQEDGRFDDLARAIQAAARAAGLRADPSALRFLQIGLDAVDVPAVRAFWRAVLGYEFDPRPGVTDIFDPHRHDLPIFFQQMAAGEHERRQQRNRIHVDLYLPDDQVRARLDTALAAGGRIVSDRAAPWWWTVADPEGNEVDIAVSVGDDA